MSDIGILVTGSRDYKDRNIVYNILQKYKDNNCTLIHGDCRGLDKIAESVAKELGFKTVAFPPNWSKFGRGAGPARNKEMLDYLNKNFINKYIFAFHDNIEESKGTKNCIEEAMKMGLKYELIKH